MKKNLLTIGLLAVGFAVNAQMTTNPTVLTHVDDGATFYVGKGALVYNGGGLQTKDTGVLENHGSVMVSGNGTTDVLRTLNGTADKTEGSSLGGTIVNKLNEPTAYSTYNSPTNPSVFTYGQLYISGLKQDNITAIVNQEFRQIKHGDYQQIGLPFYNKSFSSLSTEFNKTFNTTRWTKNEILYWNNTNTVFDNLPSISSLTGVPTQSYGYYILGSLNLDTSSQVFTVKGRPYAEEKVPSLILKDAGANVTFGTGGNNINQYNEKYNTYLQDGFSATFPWSGNYGKNIYQFSNPFLTNLDLSWVAQDEPGSSGVHDGVNLSNIQGIRLEVSGVQFTQNAGGGSSSYRFVVFPSGVPSGDTDYLVVRPMGTFVIKLLNNTTQPTFDFLNLRRFNYLGRANNINYSVTAAKSAATTGTVKQLTVIGLDNNNNEVARTYYLVSPDTFTGHNPNAVSQVTNPTGAVLGTFEEALTGGYDTSVWSNYWLYINEANEVDFQGKNVKLVKYTNNITKYKFEVKENNVYLPEGAYPTSTGIGFYYKSTNGTPTQIHQGDIITVSGNEYDLYYGAPTNLTLATTETVAPSRTMVVYEPQIENYVVMFDPRWKKADIQVYDMSGKLVLAEKGVKTDTNYVINLSDNLKAGYVVKIVSSNGEVVSTKILK